MNTAIVHIDCATDSIPEVAEALAALPGVSEVYSVAGNVDLIAVVRVPRFGRRPGADASCLHDHDHDHHHDHDHDHAVDDDHHDHDDYHDHVVAGSRAHHAGTAVGLDQRRRGRRTISAHRRGSDDEF